MYRDKYGMSSFLCRNPNCQTQRIRERKILLHGGWEWSGNRSCGRAVKIHRRQLERNLRTASPETLACHDRLCLPESAQYSLCLWPSFYSVRSQVACLLARTAPKLQPSRYSLLPSRSETQREGRELPIRNLPPHNSNTIVTLFLYWPCLPLLNTEASRMVSRSLILPYCFILS